MNSSYGRTTHQKFVARQIQNFNMDNGIQNFRTRRIRTQFEFTRKSRKKPKIF